MSFLATRGFQPERIFTIHYKTREAAGAPDCWRTRTAGGVGGLFESRRRSPVGVVQIGSQEFLEVAACVSEMCFDGALGAFQTFCDRFDG